MLSATTPSPVYAGFWIRLVAHVVDLFVFSLVFIPLTLYLTGFGHSASVSGASILINYVLPALAVCLFWYYRSATPGKMIFRLKIVDAHTLSQLSVRQTIVRYFAYIVAIVPLFLGLVWVAFDSRKQGLHDKIAATVVVVAPPAAKKSHQHS